MSAFNTKDLLDCYARGVFPMADAREDDRVFLVDPDRRGVLPLGGLRISRRLARRVRADPFAVTINRAFHQVVLACAAATPGRTETWINRPIEALYLQLHQLGHAHSVECWEKDTLVGGLYGVTLKGAFFGESMFSRRTDASKVALVHLVGRLIAGGYRLLDAQFMTDHLAQFGAEEIDRREYKRRLTQALKTDADFYRLGSGGGGDATGPAVVASGGLEAATTFDLGGGAGRITTGGVSGRDALQLITQAS